MEKVTVIRVEEKYEKNKDIKNLLKYIVRSKTYEGTVEHWGTRGTLKDIQKAYEEIVGVQEFIGKTNGRRIHHLIISFAKEIKDKQMIIEIAEELADHLGKEYQLLYGIHMDTDNWHIHIAMNSVSYRTGKKWHANLREFDDWRKQMFKIVSNQFKKHGYEFYYKNIFQWTENFPL